MKKVFIFVPHQDDEINLAGNILEKLCKLNEVFVVYSSLDTRIKQGKARYNEAIKACKIMGIDKEHIIFLNYPDTHNKNGSHYFGNGNHGIVHDFINILKQHFPEIILANDFDFHSDHRMVSIAIEEAIKEINKYHRYTPLLLKGFCYETSFYGPTDYSASKLGECNIINDVMSNPSYEWEKRISIYGDNKPKLICMRKAYWAIAAHKSQYILGHALSIINSDNVFWVRRTDNLLLEASAVIETTSGDIEKLRDFKIIDTDDIITLDSQKIDFSKSLWKTETENTIIRIKFSEKHVIRQIVFHGNPNCSEFLDVYFTIKHDGIERTYKGLNPYGRDTIIDLADNAFSSENFMIMTNARELSEIEVFDKVVSHQQILDYIGITDKAKDYNRIKAIDLIDYVIHRFFMAIQKIRRLYNETMRTGL